MFKFDCIFSFRLLCCTLLFRVVVMGCFSTTNFSSFTCCLTSCVISSRNDIIKITHEMPFCMKSNLNSITLLQILLFNEQCSSNTTSKYGVFMISSPKKKPFMLKGYSLCKYWFCFQAGNREGLTVMT